MKELQTANENKQKELETVRKVGEGAATLQALSSASCWASLSCPSVQME